jgi:hypothetical protein
VTGAPAIAGAAPGMSRILPLQQRLHNRRHRHTIVLVPPRLQRRGKTGGVGASVADGEGQHGRLCQAEQHPALTRRFR